MIIIDGAQRSWQGEAKGQCLVQARQAGPLLRYAAAEVPTWQRLRAALLQLALALLLVAHGTRLGAPVRREKRKE
jgi:hypothetical protein